MTIERGQYIPYPWALDGVNIDDYSPPQQGTSYRKPSISDATIRTGQLYGGLYDSASTNEIMYRLSAIVRDAERQGILAHHTSTVYPQYGMCMGSDGLIYVSKGNSNTGNDPVADTSYTYWSPLFKSGSLTVTLSGGSSTTPTLPARYRKVGNMLLLQIDGNSFSGDVKPNGSGVSLTITGLIPFIDPNIDIIIPAPIVTDCNVTLGHLLHWNLVKSGSNHVLMLRSMNPTGHIAAYVSTNDLSGAAATTQYGHITASIAIEI